LRYGPANDSRVCGTEKSRVVNRCFFRVCSLPPIDISSSSSSSCRVSYILCASPMTLMSFRVKFRRPSRRLWGCLVSIFCNFCNPSFTCSSSCSSSGPSYGILNLTNVTNIFVANSTLARVMHFKILTKGDRLFHPLHLLIRPCLIQYVCSAMILMSNFRINVLKVVQMVFLPTFVSQLSSILFK